MALFLFASEYENGDFDAQMEKKVRAAIEDALQIQNRETKIEEEMAARVNVLKDISASMARELGREATLRLRSAQMIGLHHDGEADEHGGKIDVPVVQDGKSHLDELRRNDDEEGHLHAVQAEDARVEAHELRVEGDLGPGLVVVRLLGGDGGHVGHDLEDDPDGAAERTAVSQKSPGTPRVR